MKTVISTLSMFIHSVSIQSERISIIFILCLGSIISGCNSNGFDREKLSQALAKYDSFEEFNSQGVCRTSLSGQYYYIDLSGNEIDSEELIDYENNDEEIDRTIFSKYDDFIDDLPNEAYGKQTEHLIAICKNGNWGFTNKKGKELIPCKYEGNKRLLETVMTEGIALIYQNEKAGFVKEGGKEIAPFIYDNASTFDKGYATVMKYQFDGEDMKWGWGVIDKNGKEIIKCKYYEIYTCGSENIFIIKDWKNQKCGAIDIQEEELIPSIYDDVYCWVNDKDENIRVVAVSQNNMYAIVDNKWNISTPFEYRRIEFCSEDGLIKAKDKDSKYALLTNQGGKLTLFKYDYIENFKDNIAKVSIGNLEGLIDKTGKEIIPCIFDNLSDYVNGLARASINGDEGFIDKDGYFIGKGYIKKISEF